MSKDSFTPRILIIDDLFGRTHRDGRNREREALCGLYLLKDITGDEEGKGTTTLNIKQPIAEAVFFRGQKPVSAGVGDTVDNDLEGTLKVIADGWNKPPYWSLVLLDLCFYTGKVTAESSQSKGEGMPEGREGDDNPEQYFGLSILEAINKHFPGLPVVILSGKSREEVSREYSIMGAQAFIPRSDEKGPELLKEYLYKYGLLPDEAGEIVGRSKALLTALNSIRRTAFAGDRRNILIRGERGTGKELFARFIHRQRAKDKTSPFIVVDSSNLTEELFSSLLFGIESNVATGVAARKGLIKEADKGELFFDEIKDMLPQVQAGVLRVLQEKNIIPVGANKAIPVDVSFISATNIDIEQLAIDGSFRPDLLDRLREGGTIFLPPLRERIEDIPLLTEKFVRAAERSIPRARCRIIEPEALEKLMRHDWPGNIRDLKNCITNAVMQYPDVEHLVPLHIRFPEEGKSVKETASLPDYSKRQIETQVQAPEKESLSVTKNAFEEGQLPAILREQSRVIVNYILQALEINRNKGNNEPNYPQTWMAMTGDNKRRNSSEYQRFIGNYIFQLPDEDIVSLMKKSEVFKKAVLQCGSKIHSAKKRIEGIKKIIESN